MFLGGCSPRSQCRGPRVSLPAALGSAMAPRPGCPLRCWLWGALWGLIAAASPITARFGGDVTLSCLFPTQPGMDLQRLTLTWQKERAGAEALVVHSYYYGRDQLARQDEAYRNQTWLDPEGLAQGNAALMLRGVRPQDESVYRCHVHSELGSTVETRELAVNQTSHSLAKVPGIAGNSAGLIAAASPITAQFGGDATLSCLFPTQPGMDLQRLTLTWQKERVGAEALVVHSYYYGRDQLARQDEAYRNRTWLDPEGLAQGNASLTLRGVRPQDEGVYRCHVHSELGSTVETRELAVNETSHSLAQVPGITGNSAGSLRLSSAAAGLCGSWFLCWVSAWC